MFLTTLVGKVNWKILVDLYYTITVKSLPADSVFFLVLAQQVKRPFQTGKGVPVYLSLLPVYQHGTNVAPCCLNFTAREHYSGVTVVFLQAPKKNCVELSSMFKGDIFAFTYMTYYLKMGCLVCNLRLDGNQREVRCVCKLIRS